MVVVAQLVRVVVCGSIGRGFESPHPPALKGLVVLLGLFCFINKYLILCLIIP